MTKSDIKSDREEWSYRRHLLEAFLVSSVSEDSFRFPTIEEFILSELVNGTIEYIGGNAGNIDYQKFTYNRNDFEKELCNYFETEMSAHSKGKLNSDIREAIVELCGHYYVNPTGPDSPYPETELYTHFKGFCGGGICPVITQSSFSLSQDIIANVQKNVLPRFSDSEQKDIVGIGKSMRPYIDRDLEHIKETYLW